MPEIVIIQLLGADEFSGQKIQPDHAFYNVVTTPLDDERTLSVIRMKSRLVHVDRT